MPSPGENERKRVSVVGFCNDSRDWAPYEDAGMQIWGLNRACIFMQRADVWFELHGPGIVSNQTRRPGSHIDWLKQFPGSVYMHQALAEVPNSVDYPLERVAKELGANIYRVDKDGKQKSTVDEPYLSSSIAQEIALAITEGYEEIHLYGVDLNTDSEYAWQKPGVEFMLGFAAGRGIKVVLPDNCPLLKGSIYGRGYLSPRGEQMSMEQLEARSKALGKERAEVSRQLAELTGAKRELGFIQEQMVPGLDHERLDERRRKMQEALAQMQQRLLQIEGGVKELAYWIHQTPQGQDPAEAVEQLQKRNGNGHKVGGPVTELECLQYPEQTETPVFAG